MMLFFADWITTLEEQRGSSMFQVRNKFIQHGERRRTFIYSIKRLCYLEPLREHIDYLILIRFIKQPIHYQLPRRN